MFKQMRGPLVGMLAVTALATGPNVSAKTGTTPVLFVGNSTGDTISVIDVVAKKTIATVTVGNVVHAVCSQGDGRKVFTTIESENALKVIDTATNKLTDTIALTGRPNECAATQDGHYIVVPIVTDNTADIVDMTQKKVVKTLPIKGPHNCFSPVGGSNDVIYCEERRGYDIAKIDMKTQDIVDRISVNGDPRPFVVTPDGKTMYVAESDLHGFDIVDVPGRKIAQVVLPPASFMPCTIETANTPTHGIALTPDLKQVWATDVIDGGMYVYDISTKKLSAKISVGKCPNWISISSDGKYVAVSNAESDSVSIVDGKTHKVLAEVPVGKGPKRLEIVDVPREPVTN
jgi:YVTN family beta-propeller protein